MNLLRCEFTQMQIYTYTNLHQPWRSHRHTLVFRKGKRLNLGNVRHEIRQIQLTWKWNEWCLVGENEWQGYIIYICARVSLFYSASSFIEFMKAFKHNMWELGLIKKCMEAGSKVVSIGVSGQSQQWEKGNAKLTSEWSWGIEGNYSYSRLLPGSGWGT